MKSMRSLIESIDELDNDNVTKTRWHLNTNYYHMPHNYISSWLDEFDKLKENNQKLDIKAFKKNFEKLSEVLDNIPRYKQFLSNPGKKFFKSERDAFTSIFHSVNTIREEFFDYVRELRDVRVGSQYWHEHHEKIVNALENIQAQIDILEKQGSLVSRALKYTDNFGKGITPMDPLV